VGEGVNVGVGVKVAVGIGVGVALMTGGRVGEDRVSVGARTPAGEVAVMTIGVCVGPEVRVTNSLNAR
jgi:hypothetical protein